MDAWQLRDSIVKLKWNGMEFFHIIKIYFKKFLNLIMNEALLFLKTN
jgi:hypothetical protein